MPPLASVPRRIRLALCAVVLASLVVFLLRLWLLPSTRLLAIGIAGCLTLLTAVAACILFLPAWLVARDVAGKELEPEQRASAVSGARSTIVQGIVGLLALAGIFVAWQQLQNDREQARTDRQQLREQLTLSRQGQVNDRFTRAVDQLGRDRPEIAVAGVYGLEQITKESPDLRPVVFDVLTAYLRQHAARNPKDAAAHMAASELKPLPPDVQAAMTVLRRRTVMATDSPLNLSNVDVHGFDLRGARLTEADFRHAQLQGAIFTEAQLQRADLSGADLSRVKFNLADLTSANLSGAQISGVDLFQASLLGANLSGVICSSPCYLGNAELDMVSLHGVQLQKANMARSNLARADLQGANLSGAEMEQAILTGAQLEGANLSGARLGGADLSRAGLQGANLSRAHLEDPTPGGEPPGAATLQGARCDTKTIWPDGFDWKAAGVKLDRG